MRLRPATPAVTVQAMVTHPAAVQNATEEGAAVSTDTLFDKVVALKTESLEDGQDLPEDLKSKDTFMLSIKRLLRLEITDGSVYLKPRRPRNESRPETEGRRARPRRRRKPKASTSPDPNRGEDAPEGERRKASPRRRRPQGTPQEPRDVALPADVNDSTTIAHLCYKCAPVPPCSDVAGRAPQRVLVTLS